MCEAGVCVATPVICDDDNLCTDDSCDPDTGDCVFEPTDVDCDDNDVCTVDDQCADGACAGIAVDCGCETDTDCDDLEDGDLCNGTLFCDTTLQPNVCKVDPATIIECPDPGADDPDAPCLQPECGGAECPALSETEDCVLASGTDCEDGTSPAPRSRPATATEHALAASPLTGSATTRTLAPPTPATRPTPQPTRTAASTPTPLRTARSPAGHPGRPVPTTTTPARGHRCTPAP